MQVYFNGYTVEKIVKGRSSYEKMVVSYSYQGQSKTKNIMSFANPSVFAAIKDFKDGDSLEIQLTKNDAGYDEWASVKLVDGTGKPTDVKINSTAPAPARSTYETVEERAKKQVYIIKQSCLAQAAAYSALRSDGYPSVQEHLDLAQQFVDWVLDAGHDGMGTEE